MYLHKWNKIYVQDPIVMEKDDNIFSSFWKFRVTLNSDLPNAKRNAFWVNLGL